MIKYVITTAKSKRKNILLACLVTLDNAYRAVFNAHFKANPAPRHAGMKYIGSFEQMEIKIKNNKWIKQDYKAEVFANEHKHSIFHED